MADKMMAWAAAAKRLDVLRDHGRYEGGIVLGEAEALRRDITALREGGVHHSRGFREMYEAGQKRLATLQSAARRGGRRYAHR